MRRLPLAVAAVAVSLALAASVAAAFVSIRQARAAAGREVAAATKLVQANPATVPSLESLRAVQSARVHDPGGKLLAEYQRPRSNYGLAARLAPPEVTCESGAAGTVCIESSPGAVAPAVRAAVMLLSIVPIAAALLGFAAGHALARGIDARLRHVADTVEKAAKERAWSLRLDSSSGELGRLATSINSLLAETQERELAIRKRTLELESANKDLESFAYSVSHDLRAPLGSIDGFTQALEMDYGDQFDDNAREYFGWIREACRQMRDLIDGLLQMSRLAKHEVQRESVDLSSIARSIADSLRQSNPQRPVSFEIRDGVRTVGDERLLRAVMENLMANAWKFTRKRAEARIEFGAAGDAYYVRDNGAGFDPVHAAKMFRPFQRLHSSREFEGTGIGLATVQKIIERHGGRAWAEGEVEKGATIYFTTA
jgi:signal transduction histidine kinase